MPTKPQQPHPDTIRWLEFNGWKGNHTDGWFDPQYEELRLREEREQSGDSWLEHIYPTEKAREIQIKRDRQSNQPQGDSRTMSTKDHPDTVVTEPNVKERRFTRLLKCPLTDKELIESGDQLAQELSHLDSINSELESIKADYKAKTKAAESEIEALSNRVRNKFEMRPVDCHEIKNFETKKFCILRIDTGEVIKERDLRQDELQLPLPETSAEDAAETNADDDAGEEE